MWYVNNAWFSIEMAFLIKKNSVQRMGEVFGRGSPGWMAKKRGAVRRPDHKQPGDP